MPCKCVCYEHEIHVTFIIDRISNRPYFSLQGTAFEKVPLINCGNAPISSGHRIWIQGWHWSHGPCKCCQAAGGSVAGSSGRFWSVLESLVFEEFRRVLVPVPIGVKFEGPESRRFWMLKMLTNGMPGDLVSLFFLWNHSILTYQNIYHQVKVPKETVTVTFVLGLKTKRSVVEKTLGISIDSIEFKPFGGSKFPNLIP